mmetsp:Transcript_2814/g.6040  ORF Transcript_2814/g.6040 Transcript_2814/m.6040 type:complete len:396 (+) Transcript_2814:1452-2639(+)
MQGAARLRAQAEGEHVGTVSSDERVNGGEIDLAAAGRAHRQSRLQRNLQRHAASVGVFCVAQHLVLGVWTQPREGQIVGRVAVHLHRLPPVEYLQKRGVGDGLQRCAVHEPVQVGRKAHHNGPPTDLKLQRLEELGIEDEVVVLEGDDAVRGRVCFAPRLAWICDVASTRAGLRVHTDFLAVCADDGVAVAVEDSPGDPGAASGVLCAQLERTYHLVGHHRALAGGLELHETIRSQVIYRVVGGDTPELNVVIGEQQPRVCVFRPLRAGRPDLQVPVVVRREHDRVLQRSHGCVVALVVCVGAVLQVGQWVHCRVGGGEARWLDRVPCEARRRRSRVFGWRSCGHRCRGAGAGARRGLSAGLRARPRGGLGRGLHGGLARRLPCGLRRGLRAGLS